MFGDMKKIMRFLIQIFLLKSIITCLGFFDVEGTIALKNNQTFLPRTDDNNLTSKQAQLITPEKMETAKKIARLEAAQFLARHKPDNLWMERNFGREFSNLVARRDAQSIW
ncbi:hypothetical protein EDEG_00375 [Edhazardia aedis USNM 41457]|uniref:Uncharacterized protein n=1 Tax=Edhazardia aedis (strain USNM 41457) TaxID=1003232 RepID=J9D2H8_EDHAE|nr:hypothetical protein EDEG_00375 [Edhazardia aedis USNM 41457]|eukprot:EJW01784.1 hypothetical protein EDEG_00375 [Edhazardia aedis USNM 41457]